MAITPFGNSFSDSGSVARWHVHRNIDGWLIRNRHQAATRIHLQPRNAPVAHNAAMAMKGKLLLPKWLTSCPNASDDTSEPVCEAVFAPTTFAGVLSAYIQTTPNMIGC
jgi:hypothetical protein